MRCEASTVSGRMPCSCWIGLRLLIDADEIVRAKTARPAGEARAAVERCAVEIGVDDQRHRSLANVGIDRGAVADRHRRVAVLLIAIAELAEDGNVGGQRESASACRRSSSSHCAPTTLTIFPVASLTAACLRSHEPSRPYSSSRGIAAFMSARSIACAGRKPNLMRNAAARYGGVSFAAVCGK